MSAAVVLEHLASVGVWDRDGGATPAWAPAPRAAPRAPWVFPAAIVLALSIGGGGYAYARKVEAERHAEARRLEAEVADALATNAVAGVRGTDATLSRVFELDSRSEAAALLWLDNRVL